MAHCGPPTRTHSHNHSHDRDRHHDNRVPVALDFALSRPRQGGSGFPGDLAYQGSAFRPSYGALDRPAVPADYPVAADGRHGRTDLPYPRPRDPLSSSTYFPRGPPSPPAVPPDYPRAQDGRYGRTHVDHEPPPAYPRSPRSSRSGSVPRQSTPRGGSRDALAVVAAETVDICRRGFYISPSGQAINISREVADCVRGTELFRPDHQFPLGPPGIPRSGRIEVTQESVFACARRLASNGASVAILNFASPIKPGGGFLNGAVAQEEAIARASSLYLSIEPKQEMYNFGRHDHNPLYSDYMIYSPGVMYFRDDEHRLLDRPFLVSVITAAAPNAKECVASAHRGAIVNTLKNRLRKVIQLAALRCNNVLVLGAFGCGVYGNDPADVARSERELLIGEGLAMHFDLIANPVLSAPGHSDNFAAFQRELGRY